MRGSEGYDEAASRPRALGRYVMKTHRAILAVLLLAFVAGRAAEIDLRPAWDETAPLANPDKGWYHHLFDNHVDKYRLESDDDLLRFPGMDHIYLRLAWAYLEPEEGRFNWRVLDDVIEKWTAKGLGISFRISCKETSVDRVEQQFATPRWVRDAGARGGHYVKGKPAGPDTPWEPRFDDPVFLARLEHFLTAFAARYDGKPWLRYVDIGSVGDWGEGHTWAGSQIKYDYDTLARHVDLHTKYFRRTPLVVSDDFVFALPDAADRRRLHEKVLGHGIGYRDDSILVDWYIQTYPGTGTVRSPEFFRAAAPHTPAVLELEHYGIVKRKGNWEAGPDSTLARCGGGRSGAELLRVALEQLQATYIGYHGYAREWLADNPALTVELLNRCGYWFFPHTVRIPDTFVAGRTNIVTVSWQNRGVAPAYRPYELVLRLEGPDTHEARLPAGNTRWMPGPAEKPWREDYAFAPPATLRPGDYMLKFKLRSSESGRDVKLPLKSGLLDSNGFYPVANTRLHPAS